MNNLNIKTNNKLINEKINSNLVISIKSITTDNQTPLGPLQIDASIHNADANAVLMLRHYLQQEKTQATGNKKNEQMVKRLLLNIASKSLTFTINNASIITGNNEAIVQANIQIPKLNPRTAALEITKKHHIELQLQISSGWLTSLLKLGFSNIGVTTNLKDNFYQQQIIPILINNTLIKRKDNGSYFTKIQIDNGSAKVLGNKESKQQLSKTIADIMTALANQSQESTHDITTKKTQSQLKNNALETESKSK